MPTKRSGRRAFTLIELLVVIGIIVILAAILFPVYARAREKARQAWCTSNLRQVAMSFTLYVRDYDDKNPPDQCYWVPPMPDTEFGLTWMEMVYPYARNTEVFKCPNGRPESPDPCGIFPIPIACHYCWPSWIRYDYYRWGNTSMFCGFPPGEMWGGNPYRPWSYGRSIAFSKHLAQAAFLIPGEFPTWPHEGLAFGSGGGSSFSRDPTNEVVWRHSGGGNIAFCDGHVKWVHAMDFNANSSDRTGAVLPGIPCSPYMHHVD